MPNHSNTTWLYRNISTDKVEGPFDLIELAGLLRSGDVTGDTLTKHGEDTSWIPFQNRREFETARNMPLEVISLHLKEEAEKQNSAWSLRGLYYFGVLVFGVIGHGLFSGIRPTWLTNEFQKFILEAIHYFGGR